MTRSRAVILALATLAITGFLLFLRAHERGLAAASREGGIEHTRTDVRPSCQLDPVRLRSPGLVDAQWTFACGSNFVPPDGAVSVSVRFEDERGELLWQADHLPPVPVAEWRPGETIHYQRTFLVPRQERPVEVQALVGLVCPGAPGRVFDMAGPAVRPGWHAVGGLSVAAALGDPRISEMEGIAFGAGWYPWERSPVERRWWRWMAGEGRLSLPALEEPADFLLQGWLAAAEDGPPVEVEFVLDGQSFERARSTTGDLAVRLEIPPAPPGCEGPRDLLVRVSAARRTGPAGGDPRELGLMMTEIYYRRASAGRPLIVNRRPRTAPEP